MDGSQARVTHGFLDGEPRLFASYHAPAEGAPARNIAYVVCLPLHLDLIQSHRSMRVCAEELALAGFHVMRLHYDGTGESVASTDQDPDRVAAWLDSVRRAALAMAAIPGVEGVGLVGVRIGAAFALEISTRLDIARLVLWEPSAGAMYAREMEILASSAPQPRDAAGGLVAGGYWLSPQTLADLGKLAVEKMEPRGKPDVLLVYRGDRKPSPRLQQHLERLGCPTTVAQLPGHKEMMVMPQKSLVPFAIVEAIRQWAVERSRPLAEASPVQRGITLAAEAVVSGVRWRVVELGAKGHLFGVLTEPASGAEAGRPALLLLTGGVTPRTAGNGSYVSLARRLAAKGHAVLRMDVSNIGESGMPDGSRGDANANEPFPPSIVDDARAGLERLSAAVAKGTKLWIYGLCSGAYAAFQLAVEEPRGYGVFIVNPERFQIHAVPAQESTAERPAELSTADQLEQMNRYWQVMRDPASWKKLLSGKADVRHLARVVGARVESKLASTKERVAARLGRAPKGLAGDFDKLLARGTHVHLVFSEGDPGHAVVVTELGARLDQLLRKGLDVKVFPRADHNFHEMDSRREMLDWVDATISGAAPNG